MTDIAVAPPPPKVEPPLPAEDAIDYSQIVTEDDTPVDNLFSEKQQRLLTEPLYSGWAGDGRPFLALANVGLFFAADEQPLVPDAMLSLGVKPGDDLWEKRHRSYFVWEHGKPPEAVIEIVSNKKGGEAAEKLQTYARIGVAYYVIFDPELQLGSEVLRVFHEPGRRYRRMKEPYRFEELGLGLTLWRGTFENVEAEWLRWYLPDGTLVPTGYERAEAEKKQAAEQRRKAREEKRRADAADERAEQEKQRAEQEKQRAEQEKQRADRLAAQLMALGIKPQD